MRNEKVKALRLAFDRAKAAYYSGGGSYEDMREAAGALVAEMNIAGAEIAKRFGRKHKPISAGAVMR